METSPAAQYEQLLERGLGGMIMAVFGRGELDRIRIAHERIRQRLARSRQKGQPANG